MIPPSRCHLGAPELNKFFTTEGPNDLPDLEVLNEFFENCADYTRCPKCLCFGVLGRRGPKTIACATSDCWKSLSRELLPSAYLLGLPKHDNRRPRSSSADMDTATPSHEIDILHQKIDRLQKLVERLIGAQENHSHSPTVPPNASQSTQPALYSQAHIVQPTRSVAWARIASNYPAHLKDTLKEMRAEHMQDRDHRRNRKKEYAGEYVRVFVNGIPRFQAKSDANGRMMSRVERTEILYWAIAFDWQSQVDHTARKAKRTLALLRRFCYI